YGVESPDEPAGLRIEGLHAAPGAQVTAAEAGDDHAVVVQRRADDAVSLRGVFGLHAPDRLAGALVQRDQLRIETSDEHHAVAERHAAIDPAAAGAHAAGLQLRLVAPQDVALVDADRD